MAPTLLITRPQPGSAEFANAARAVLGKGAVIEQSSVMKIVAQGDMPDLRDIRALILTSRQGVAQFIARSNRRDLPVYAVGDGTAQAARAAGLKAVSAQGDAADLVARVLEDGTWGPMIHLRGAYAAGDVAGALQTAGVDAREAVIYAQQSVPLSKMAINLLNGEKPVVLPLFSPRSSKLLFEQVMPRAPLVVLAISKAVAQTVPTGLSAQVRVVTRPDADAMLDALPDVWEQANRLEGDRAAQ
ncbi:uroporphyrinogen-III synthase [Roseovarius aestuarii]|nr:uroporphyrinogen-III synthase [Roseovarius aestuarii]